MMARGHRRLTGRHVLVWFLAFFGVVALVNAVMIWFALTTNRGVVDRVSMIRSSPGPVVVMEMVRKGRSGWRS